MVALLEAIKEELKASGLFKTVFLTEHLGDDGDIIPKSMRYPAAGIKDGGEDPPQDGSADSLSRFPLALVAVYAPVQASREPGEGLIDVLTLSDSVRRILHRNLLGLPGLFSALDQGAEESTLLEFKGGAAVRVLRAFRYEYEDEEV